MRNSSAKRQRGGGQLGTPSERTVLQSPAPFRQKSPQSAAQERHSRAPAPPGGRSPAAAPSRPGRRGGGGGTLPVYSRHFSERVRRARLPVRIPPRPRARPGLPARKETRTAREAPPLSGQLRNLIGSRGVIGSSLCRQPAAMLCAGQGAAAVGPCPRLAPGSPPGSEGRHGPVQPGTAQYGPAMSCISHKAPHHTAAPSHSPAASSAAHPTCPPTAPHRPPVGCGAG